MKKLLILGTFCTLFISSSCETNKRADMQDATTTDKGGANIDLYLTSRETTDPTFCDKAAMLQTDCGIEDIYLTLKGNVILRAYCKDETEAAWLIGKYEAGDSGIICQMDKVYMVSLAKTGDTINYNRGRYLELQNKDPFLLERTNCEGISYLRRYNQKPNTDTAQKNKQRQTVGRVYFEDKDVAAKMLGEMRKVKALSAL